MRTLSHRQMQRFGRPRRVDGNKLGLGKRRRVGLLIFINPDDGKPPIDGPWWWGISPNSKEDYSGPFTNSDGTLGAMRGWRIIRSES